MSFLSTSRKVCQESKIEKSVNIFDVFDIPLKASVYVAWFHGFEMFFGTDSQTFVYKGIDTRDTLNWRYEFSISGSYDSLNYLLFSLDQAFRILHVQLGHEIFEEANLLVTLPLFCLVQKDWSTKETREISGNENFLTHNVMIFDNFILYDSFNICVSIIFNNTYRLKWINMILLKLIFKM